MGHHSCKTPTAAVTKGAVSATSTPLSGRGCGPRELTGPSLKPSTYKAGKDHDTLKAVFIFWVKETIRAGKCDSHDRFNEA